MQLASRTGPEFRSDSLTCPHVHLERRLSDDQPTGRGGVGRLQGGAESTNAGVRVENAAGG